MYYHHELAALQRRLDLRDALLLHLPTKDGANQAPDGTPFEGKLLSDDDAGFVFEVHRLGETQEVTFPRSAVSRVVPAYEHGAVRATTQPSTRPARTWDVPPEPKAPQRLGDWFHDDAHRGLKAAVTLDSKQCLACHALPDKEWERLRAQPDAWTKAHAEVIKLMDEVRTTRANLQKA